jgi:hypothetical protein
MSARWREHTEPLQRLLESAGPDDLALAAERAAALLDEVRSGGTSSEAGGSDLDDVVRLRRLAVSAAEVYQGWLTITAARTAGYDGCGAPAPLEIGSVCVEG